MPRPSLLSLVIAVAALLAVACGGDGGGRGRPTLIVAAAADLRFAFEELAPAFEASCSCRLALSFGSSGRLALQIREGLPADVFFSADAAYVQELEERDLILPGSTRLYALGRIVLAVPAGSSLEPRLWDDLLNPSVRRIALPNPEHAPYGAASKQALTAVGLWETVQPKLVLGENASQAAQFVESADADAGIIPLSLAIERTHLLRYRLIDESLHAPLRQMATVIRRSRHRELAEAFISFVTGPAGHDVMTKYGLVPPGDRRQ